MNTDFPVDQDPTKDQIEQPQPPQNLGDFLTDQYNYQVPRRGDIRAGTVIEIDEHGVLMDIGSKREGLVSAEDLSYLDEETRSEIKIGDSINVFVVQTADRDGRPILSIQQARLYEDWIKAEQMMASGELYEGEHQAILEAETNGRVCKTSSGAMDAMAVSWFGINMVRC